MTHKSFGTLDVPNGIWTDVSEYFYFYVQRFDQLQVFLTRFYLLVVLQQSNLASCFNED